MITDGETGLLPVAFVGTSEATEHRRQAVREFAGTTVRSAEVGAGDAPATPGSVCFVALPISEATGEMDRLLRSGCHVFVDAPRLPSVRDLQQAARIAGESGVSVGVSRPLRFAPETVGGVDRASIAVIDAEFGEEPESWHNRLSDTLDLCMHLCGSGNARNVEVAVERSDRLWPVFAAASLRFDNGSLAVLRLRRSSRVRPTRCEVAADANVFRFELARTSGAYGAETTAFLRAIAHNERPPVSLSDALAGARLLDQVLALMR